jgi:hypothetical protein
LNDAVERAFRSVSFAEFFDAPDLSIPLLYDGQLTESGRFASARTVLNKLCFKFSKSRSSTCNQLDDQHYQRNHEKNVDVPGHHVKPDEAHEPRDQKNYKKCPKHLFVSPCPYVSFCDLTM